MDRLKRKDGRLRRFSRNDFLYAVLKVHVKIFGISVIVILDSSMVEHTAVNRGVVGSSPTRGA